MIGRHATWNAPRSATFVFRFVIENLAISHEASYAVAYVPSFTDFAVFGGVALRSHVCGEGGLCAARPVYAAR